MRLHPLAPTAALVLVGCSLTPETIPPGVDCGPQPNQEQMERATQTWIQRSGLKDPSSAQVRDIRLLGRRGMFRGVANGGGYEYGWLVEFQVNAKNSYGGYVGFRTRHALICPDGSIRWQMELD